jgi:hypothetical protein
MDWDYVWDLLRLAGLSIVIGLVLVAILFVSGGL